MTKKILFAHFYAWLIVCSLMLTSLSVAAKSDNFNMHSIDNRNGLPSMFVLSLYQDQYGFIWVGTYDGLYVLEGNNRQVAEYMKTVLKSFNGCIIDDIQGDNNGHIWIHSNYGLDMYDQSMNKIEHHPEIHGSYKYCISPNNDVVVLTKDQGFYYYNWSIGHFEPLPFQDIELRDVVNMNISGDDNWTIFTYNQILQVTLNHDDNGAITTHLNRRIKSEQDIHFVVNENGKTFFIDSKNCLYSCQNDGTQIRQIAKLNIIGNKNISSFHCLSNNRFVISFYQGNAYLININKEKQVSSTPLSVKCGVTSTVKDQHQKIIWIATDGEGLKYFVREPYVLHNELYSNLSISVSKPVRSIIKDRQGNLWVGTKGDGILRYAHYSPFKDRQPAVTQYTTDNSALLHNSVFHFTQGSHGIIWVSSDASNVNYIDTHSQEIRVLQKVPRETLGGIHWIVEQEGSLWVSSGNRGIFRFPLSWNGNTPYVGKPEHLLYDEKKPSKSQYTSFAISGSTLWAANRENGLRRLQIAGNHSNTLFFYGDSAGSPQNDVIYVCADHPGYIITGTSAGLFMTGIHDKAGDSPINLGDSLGIANHSVRGLLCSGGNELWISTAHHIFTYNFATRAADMMGTEDDIQIPEFSESACWLDSRDSTKYFGGTNGFLCVSKSYGATTCQLPRLQFVYLDYGNGGINLLDKQTEEIELSHDQNHLHIFFSLLNYVNYYNFEYRIDEDDSWKDAGNTGSITLANMVPGTYHLQVRYRNGSNVSNIYTLCVRILPPWYLRWPMKLLYTLILLAIVVSLFNRYKRRQERRHRYHIQAIEQKHKEDLYESKLQFFTNLTHEFGTPLTLIGGCCQRIMDSGVSNKIETYVQIVQNNLLRLNDLIQQIIEFRRIETGHRQLSIQKANVTDLLSKIFDNFAIEAEQNHIDYSNRIAAGITWNTDVMAFQTIAINLLGNAFKYVSPNGRICVVLDKTEAGQLRLSISNTGKPLSQADCKRIFDRYTILQNLENTDVPRSYARNGLGLSITKSLVQELGGDINIVSEAGEITFSVQLPPRECTAVKPMLATDVNLHLPSSVIHTQQKSNVSPYREGKPCVLVLDDDSEMLWIMQETLQESCNVFTLSDPSQIFSTLEENNIDLVITDIALGTANGLDICRQLKSDQKTSHIPVIIISGSSPDSVEVESINAGAELFIKKPFSMDYMISVVMGRLKNVTNLQTYYNSSASSFNLFKGKRLHKEDRALLEKMVKIINDNLSNPDLSTQFVSKQMGIGIRNLYRRLEGITDLMPKDIIREMRLEKARQLLTKTKLSMEEVSFSAGFANRGTFYKVFVAKFGCTPKQYHDTMMAEGKENK